MNRSFRTLTSAFRPLLVGAILISLPVVRAQIVFTDAGDVAIQYVKDPNDPDYGLGLHSVYFDLDHSGSGPVISSDWNDSEDFDFYLSFFSRPGVETGTPVVLAWGADFVSASTVIVTEHNAWVPFAWGYNAGDLIGPATFGADGQYGAYLGFIDVFADDWSPGTTGYAGLRMGSNYGYVHLTWDGTSLILHDFAYELTANTAIAAGAGASAIPEPSTYAVIFGACALAGAAWRKRRGAVNPHRAPV